MKKILLLFSILLLVSTTNKIFSGIASACPYKTTHAWIDKVKETYDITERGVDDEGWSIYLVYLNCPNSHGVALRWSKDDFIIYDYYGEWIFFYEDGGQKEVSNWKNGNRDGITETFYKGIIIKSFIEYVNDTRHGQDITYYKNGQIKAKGEWYESKQHGDWIFYYENKIIRSTGKWDKGKRNGIFEYYNNDGSIESVKCYIQSRPQEKEKCKEVEKDEKRIKNALKQIILYNFAMMTFKVNKAGEGGNSIRYGIPEDYNNPEIVSSAKNMTRDVLIKIMNEVAQENPQYHQLNNTLQQKIKEYNP